EAEERAGEHDGDFGGTSGEPVEQETADVGVDATAFFGGGDDGGEVVVGEDEVGGLAGDLGAAAAHGDADVGVAERGAVVDAVAGHGDDVAGVAAGGDDVELLFRGGAREHLGGGGVGELAAVDDLAVRVDDADLDGDGAGGGRVVAGDEDRGDAGGLAGGDRGRGGGSGRVEDGDQAEQPQAGFELVDGWGV